MVSEYIKSHRKNHLAELRKRRHIAQIFRWCRGSQTEVARRLGVGAASVSGWVNHDSGFESQRIAQGCTDYADELVAYAIALDEAFNGGSEHVGAWT